MKNLSICGRDFGRPQKTYFYPCNLRSLLDRQPKGFETGRHSGMSPALRRGASHMKLCGFLSRPAFAILIMFIVAAAIVISVADLGRPNTSVMAASGPKIVQGYVNDTVGTPLEGALVTVEIAAQGTGIVRDTQTDTTGSDGYYMVSFAPSNWDIGDTIHVTATYDTNQQLNQTVANDSASQQVNVNFGFAIPEFSSLFGLVAALVAVVCVANLRIRHGH
jgi:hypothetical protein